MNVRMTRAVEIPAQERPTASPQPASSADTHWFLSDQRLVKPPLPSAMVLVSIAISYPHPSHTRRSALGPVRPARWPGPQLPRAFPTNLEPAQVVPRVCAGHRPATPAPDDRQNRAVFDTPTRYKKEDLRPRLRRSEALSHTRWQVKDSNLRSFRDGFTVHSHWPLGQPAVVRMEG